jgi:hypothetical protein
MSPIEKVIEAIYYKCCDLVLQENNRTYMPKLAVYMDPDFYYECKADLKGEMSPGAFEFYQGDKLYGYPVWIAIPRNDNGKMVKHESFRIVNLDA